MRQRSSAPVRGAKPRGVDWCKCCTPSPHAAVGCPNVLSLHSRKTQPQRTATAAEFRAARQAVLFTSDVSARGVDYPDVTLVVQASDV